MYNSQATWCQGTRRYANKFFSKPLSSITGCSSSLDISRSLVQWVISPLVHKGFTPEGRAGCQISQGQGHLQKSKARTTFIGSTCSIVREEMWNWLWHPVYQKLYLASKMEINSSRTNTKSLQYKILHGFIYQCSNVTHFLLSLKSCDNFILLYIAHYFFRGLNQNCNSRHIHFWILI